MVALGDTRARFTRRSDYTLDVFTGMLSMILHYSQVLVHYIHSFMSFFLPILGLKENHHLKSSSSYH